MPTSYLEANTFGIGELIAQKKRFRVPNHQRDFAWTDELISQFLADILYAIESNSPEYFMGLIVLVGPETGIWQVLDGQQRMTTATMVFAAIRHHLERLGRPDDSAQVDSEFLAVRQLGGAASARLTLNTSNRKVFESAIVNRLDDASLRLALEQVPLGTTNWRLLNGAIYCRDAIGKWISEGSADTETQVQSLYKLSAFLESNAQVVCLEVDTEADAYVIFESLNTRGHDLSVLDLVKNHIFSLVPEDQGEWLNDQWQSMLESLGDRDVDDFLKVFWTSQFGRIQRGGLYKVLRDTYPTADRGKELATVLAQAASMYSSLEDPRHGTWDYRSPFCRHCIEVLRTLKSKQVRPIIFSCLYRGMDTKELEKVLWALVVLTVRYQTVGRRRTGALEIGCAQIAVSTTKAPRSEAAPILSELRRLIPSDEDFASDFRKHVETQSRRILYLLGTLERWQGAHGNYDHQFVSEVISPESRAIVQRITRHIPKEYYSRLGNWLFLADGQSPRPPQFDEAVWRIQDVEERQTELAEHAVRVWSCDTDKW